MRNKLQAAMADVLAFHKAFEHPWAVHPTRQSAAQVSARADWILEEVQELRDAPTLVDQADAYLDVLYFAFGGLVELGIDPSPLWNIVQAANMAKLGSDGRPIKRPGDGKTVKPEGWKRPEPWLQAEVARQIRLADGCPRLADATPIRYGGALARRLP